MIQEPPNKTWIVIIVAIISAAAVICAAIIGLGAPFADRWADRYYPPFTPTANSVSPTDAISQNHAPTQAAYDPAIAPTTALETSASEKYSGWVICWHGKFDHEYLIAYPESTIKQGLNLSILLPQPWGGGADYLPNDSLKMCLYEGVWYGEQSTPWFPYVSYIILKNDEFSVCQDSPSCSGDTWTMKSAENPPYMEALIKQPIGSDIQILGYK